ncbi:MAG: FHA domain-containing protein [Archangium sp.]|nr:FHA domain-containing protein [Archangium sp.]
MSASAFMLSLLGRQRQLLGASFFERYPSDWLVWEPGPWRPARSILTSNAEATQLPTHQEAPRPLGEDALCFELKQTAGSSVSVGRGTENQIVINDLTVSREQFLLEFVGTSWVVRSRGTPLTVDGNPVGPAGTPLHNASVIGAGDVRMTFYSPDGFPKRLEQEGKKTAPRG